MLIGRPLSIAPLKNIARCQDLPARCQDSSVVIVSYHTPTRKSQPTTAVGTVFDWPKIYQFARISTTLSPSGAAIGQTREDMPFTFISMGKQIYLPLKAVVPAQQPTCHSSNLLLVQQTVGKIAHLQVLLSFFTRIYHYRIITSPLVICFNSLPP